MHPRTLKLTIFLFFLGILGSVMIYLATRAGLGISQESIFYLNGAFHIDSGGSYEGSIDGDLQPIVHYPPMYSFLIAIFSQFGLNLVSAARVLNILLFAINVVVAGFIFFRISGGSISWALVFAFIVMIAWPVLDIHLWAWTEPLFLFLLILGLTMLSEFFNKPRMNYLIIALVCTALTPLIKYSGLIVIPVACISIILYTPFDQRKTIFLSIIFGFFSLLPSAIWMFRNYLVSGSLTDRKISFSMISFEKMGEFGETISSWLIFPAIGDSYRMYLFFTFFMFWIMLLLFNIRQSKMHLLYFRSKQNLYILKIFTVFLFSYLIYLIIYTAFFDDNLLVDNRVLAPCFIPFLALVFHAFFLWKKFSEGNRFYKTTISFVFVMFLITNVWQWLNVFEIVNYQNAINNGRKVRYDEPLQHNRKIPSGKLKIKAIEFEPQTFQ